MSKRIVVLGAGVAGAQAVKKIHQHFHGYKDFSLTVVDRENYSAFIPMLHEVATGSVRAHDVAHPIRQIIKCCLEHFHQASVQGIDVGQRLVQTDNGSIPYDYLIVALGSGSNFFGVPGAEEHCLTLKSLDDAIILRRHLIDQFEHVSRLSRSDEHRLGKLHFVIVGAGYTGVETAGQMADLFSHEFRQLYPEITSDEPKITIVQAGERIMPILSEENSRRAHARLEKLGVNIITGARVVAVTPEGASLNNGEVIRSHNVIWTSGVLGRGGQFFSEDMCERGRVKVKSTLQLHEHPEVFVIGDIAAVTEGEGPHPQTAQCAYQQAHFVGDNLLRLVNQEPLEAFRYNHKGDLVPIGNRWAIAEIKSLSFTGFIAWWIRRTVYLQGIYSWSDRIRVVFDWTMNLFTKRDTTRL